MTNTVLLKRSSTQDSTPTTGQITYGELAINYNDGNLFYRNSVDEIKVIASNKFLSVTGNITGANVSTTGNVTGNYFIGNGSQLTGLVTSAFKTIVVPGQSNVVANTTGTLNLVGGSGVSLVTDPTTGTVTFSTVSGVSIFSTGGDMGTVVEAVTSTEDLGLITDVVSISYDLGTLVQSGLIWPDQLKLPDYSVTSLPGATPAGCLIFVTDAYGGSIPAFSDGSNWRRVDDRTVVT